MSEVIVETQNLRKYYYLKGEVVKALDGINLKVVRGEYLSIMGPSGSGKTTLFNMIGALDRPTSGRVVLEGRDLSTFSDYELEIIRCQRIGYILQTFNLIYVITALENVEMTMMFEGVPKSERRKKAKELLELVGLGDRINHRPTELSGGQQQRVAIARALANDPAIVLADEPTGNLDLATGRSIIMLLKKVSTERGVTVISATHDLKMIDVSNRVVWIRDGKIEKIRRREELIVDAGMIEGMEL
ncbi:MAG: ABC transporter ATP-binding protein [Thermoproteota archaeon]|nr:MAG: ABC transporter ATP-binding protein [Candidatus Korarchaeota archaeon]